MGRRLQAQPPAPRRSGARAFAGGSASGPRHVTGSARAEGQSHVLWGLRPAPSVLPFPAGCIVLRTLVHALHSLSDQRVTLWISGSLTVRLEARGAVHGLALICRHYCGAPAHRTKP